MNPILNVFVCSLESKTERALLLLSKFACLRTDQVVVNKNLHHLKLADVSFKHLIHNAKTVLLNLTGSKQINLVIKKFVN